MTKFVTDSGKLQRLDQLLVELKANGHRVLIYFQMTKMMDLHGGIFDLSTIQVCAIRWVFKNWGSTGYG